MEVQKLEYNRPCDKDILQYAVINRIQIGTSKERFDVSSTVRFQNMSNVDSHRSFEEVVINADIEEISYSFKYWKERNEMHIPKRKLESLILKVV